MMLKNAIAYQKARKLLLVCAAFVSLVSMALYTILENTYLDYPRVPDPALGRVVRHEVKGIAVYITKNQSEAIHLITWILIVSGAITLALLLLNQKWPLQSNK